MNGTITIPGGIGATKSILSKTKQGSYGNAFTYTLVDATGTPIPISGVMTGRYAREEDVYAFVDGSVIADADQVTNPGEFTHTPPELNTMYAGDWNATFEITESGVKTLSFGGKWTIEATDGYSTDIGPPDPPPGYEYMLKVAPATEGNLVQQTADGGLTDGEAPQDGKPYSRQDAAWVETTGGDITSDDVANLASDSATQPTVTEALDNRDLLGSADAAQAAAIAEVQSRYGAALANHYATQQDYGGTYYYVDSVIGNDGNAGTSPSTAKATINAGFALLSDSDTLFVYAPESHPLREQLDNDIATSAFNIRGLGSTKWFIFGSTQFTSGWTDAGGGVYSRVVAVGTNEANASVTGVVVLSQIDSDGYGYLLQSAGTSTTPSAGQFGYATDTIYVRLPDSGNANANTLEVGTKTQCICQRGADGTLNLYDCVAKYGTLANISVGRVRPEGGGSAYGTDQGYLNATDCESWYGSNAGSGGLTTTWRFQGARYTRCKAIRNGQDGFNLHSYGTATIYPQVFANNCEAYENGRSNGAGIGTSVQGYSSHDLVVGTITGGKYHHNHTTNLLNVGDSYCVIDGGAEFSDCYIGDGIGATVNASLIIKSAIAARNAASGLDWDSAGTLEYVGLISGTDLGNGDPDDVT